MIKKYILALTVLLSIVLMLGCSDRGDNVTKPDYDVRNGFESAITNDGGHIYSFYLAFSMFADIASQPKVDARIYVPKDYDLAGGSESLPTLYLLAPFRGNAFYYFNHDLSVIADQLIAAGEIEPMIIVCVDGSHGYGATFYGDSWAGGKYASLLGEKTDTWPDGSIIDWVQFALKTKSDRTQRAIAGVGLGGYGAMRVAIEHNENYGSISAISAPLDFDGASGSGGFISMFPQVVVNLTTDGLTYKEMSATLDRPLRTILMGAACSFSPHIDYDRPIWPNPPMALDTLIFDDTLSLFRPEGTASTIAFHLPFDENGNIPDTLIPTIFYDSSTIISNIDSLVIPWDTTWLLVVDTINDTCGYYDSLWNMWMDNNVENILVNNPDALDDTEIKFFTTSVDQLGFNQQTNDFSSYLTSHLAGRGITKNLTPVNLEGYDNYDGTVNHLIYDMLPQILKFHSDVFEAE